MADQHNKHPELQEGDLLAYLEGSADPDVAARIAQSPNLATAAADLRAIDTLMSSALQRDSCPELDELLLYQAGLLSQVEEQSIKRHITGCDACQHELAQLADPTSAPSAPPIQERVVQAGKRLLTALLRPTAPQPALALRGDQQRQYAYQAGDYQILVALIPPVVAENIWQIEGQISGQDDSLPLRDAVALLMRQNSIVARDVVDEFGFFALEQIGPGSYTLQLELPTDSILIENVTVP